MFPKLKESVEQASTTQGTESIDDPIAHLLQDMPTNAVNSKTENLTNAAPSSQELCPRRRSLPHTLMSCDQKTIEYLKASIVTYRFLEGDIFFYHACNWGFQILDGFLITGHGCMWQTSSSWTEFLT